MFCKKQRHLKTRSGEIMPTINITTVQFDINWLDKQKNLNALSQLLDKVNNTDLIVLPETFSTGFAVNLDIGEPEQSGVVLEWMKNIASKKNAVVAGSVLVNSQAKKANRFYWVWPHGDVAYYDKRHLFRLSNEGEHVIAGDTRHVFSINDIKILPLVCYDLRFPVWARNRNDYDIMINVANWPAARRTIWDTLLKARAIENQSYVVGVNRIGDDGNGTPHNGGTAVYDFNGEPLFQAPDNQASVHSLTLNLDELSTFKDKFPIYLDADEFDIHQ